MEEGNGSHDSRKLSKMLKGKVLILCVTLACTNGLEEEHITKNGVFLCCMFQVKALFLFFLLT